MLQRKYCQGLLNLDWVAFVFSHQTFFADPTFVDWHVWYTRVAFYQNIVSSRMKIECTQLTMPVFTRVSRHLIFSLTNQKSFLRKCFRDCQIEWDMPLWKVIWNNVYSPFKVCYLCTIEELWIIHLIQVFKMTPVLLVLLVC